jgi:DNA-binding transcriptional LysR family regulator
VATSPRNRLMLSLSQVSAFLAVVETGTFQGAAAQLGLAQATVSQHVRALEDGLATQLVVRSRVRCTPTVHGVAFLRHARTLLRLADRAERSVRDRRTLIGASGNTGVYLLPPMMRRFLRAGGDGTTLDLVIAPNPEIAQKLQDGVIDLAVMEWWDNRPGFTARPWRRESMVVIVAPDHPWVRRQSIRKEELLATPLIAGEPGTGTAALLRGVFGNEAKHLRVSYTLGSTEAVKNAVKAGLGVSLVMTSAIQDELAAGTLCAIRIARHTLAKQIMLVVPEDTPATAPSARFSDLLTGGAA